MRSPAAAPAAALVLVSLLGVAQADFSDDNYHAQILYEVDTAEIDVLIVPPASPYFARDVSNVERSVGAWDDGINALGPPWLADGLNIHFYTLGYDRVPRGALQDPEVVIFTAEYNPVLQSGTGLAPPVTLCRDIDPAALHRHDGSPWGVQRSACDDGGYQCIVVNAHYLGFPDGGNERGMYDLNSHGFGHCLGIGHVGDTVEFLAQNHPSQDIMAHGPDLGHVRCVSSLNILALEAIYGPVLGRPGPHPTVGSHVHMDPTDYETVDCIDPTNPDGTDVAAALSHDHPEPGESIAD